MAIGQNDILYQLTTEGWAVVVPELLWRYVAGAFHDTPIMGHYGPEKTLQKMKRYVYFYQMTSFVTNYIRSCIICQLYKKTYGRVQYQCTNVPPNIFHTMSIDLIGPYPTSADFHKYVMIAQCCLARYLFVIPLKTKSAEEICERLVERVFLTVGPPTKLLADNAEEFHSKLMARLGDTFGYERRFIQTYRPQQNGMNERSHAELYRWLKMYMYEAKTTRFWSTFKELLAYTYNTTPHSTLGGKTPFEVIYGRRPPLKPLGWPEHTKPVSGDYLKFLGLRDEELQTLRRDVRKIIDFNARTSLERANRRLKVPEFILGDEVLELEQKIQPNIVTPKNDWRPTYQPRAMKITEILSDAHVRVRDDVSGVERILHVDRLKRFVRRNSCVGFSHLPPRPLEDDDFFDGGNDVMDSYQDEVGEATEALLPSGNERPAGAPSDLEMGASGSNEPREPRAAAGLSRLAEKPRQTFLRLFQPRSARTVKPKQFGSEFETGKPVNIFGTRTNP
jgi:hypothetical protein